MSMKSTYKLLGFMLILAILAATACTKGTPVTINTQDEDRLIVPQADGVEKLDKKQDWKSDWGWETIAPEDAGMDVEKLEQLELALADQPIYAMVVVKDGKIVSEYYKKGYHANRKFLMNSVAKSVTSALVGIAIDHKFIDSMEQPLTDFFPLLQDELADPLKREITIKDLLSMKSGLDWPESSTWDFDLSPMIRSDHWSEFVLEFPMKDRPGMAEFDYNSGGSQLLSAILQQRTGQNLQQFADEHLFGPLGIVDYEWRTGPNRETAGGFGIELIPRDAAKFGLLYLQKGEWEGARLLSEDWVQISTMKQAEVNKDYVMSVFGDYGYHWWIRAFDSYDAYMAMGYGGQYIIVVPEFNLVVVFASYAENDTALPLQNMDTIIEAMIS